MAATIKTPITQFAQFVNADIKGGASAHAFRVSTIRRALEQMFKGNYSPISEAAALTEGKSKKARAYNAAFTALGQPGIDAQATKVDYVGKLDGHDNKAARDEIEARTNAAVVRFFDAFDAVISEKTEKAAPKAKTAPATEAAAPATEAGEVDADTVRHEMAVKVENDIEAMCTMIRTGYLTTDQFDRIAEAVAAHQHVLAHAVEMAEVEHIEVAA